MPGLLSLVSILPFGRFAAPGLERAEPIARGGVIGGALICPGPKRLLMMRSIADPAANRDQGLRAR